LIDISFDLVILVYVFNTIDKNYFDIISEEIAKINTRIQKAKQYTELPIPQYLLDNLEIINAKLNDYLISNYSDAPINIIDVILCKINNYYTMLTNLVAPVQKDFSFAKVKLENARIELLIKQLEEEFNGEIFEELFDDDGTGYTQVDDGGSDIYIQEDNIIYELYKKSIYNTLSKDINKVICIFDFLHSFDFPELLYNHNSSDFYYKDLLITTFIDLLKVNKIKKNIFLDFLPRLITNSDAHDDDHILVLISKE
jgi:hypothetical protein